MVKDIMLMFKVNSASRYNRKRILIFHRKNKKKTIFYDCNHDIIFSGLEDLAF